jgi:hypothetical protein
MVDGMARRRGLWAQNMHYPSVYGAPDGLLSRSLCPAKRYARSADKENEQENTKKLTRYAPQIRPAPVVQAQVRPGLVALACQHHLEVEVLSLLPRMAISRNRGRSAVPETCVSLSKLGTRRYAVSTGLAGTETRRLLRRGHGLVGNGSNGESEL